MEYKLNTTNYRDFKVIEDNKLAGRAYFIPYSKKEKLCAVDLKHERTDSDLVEVLSGEWDFKYYNDISLIPEVFDASGVEFDKIHVPSTWQRTGYEPPVYLNCPYEFDLPNPNVPEHMSAGIYRKTFEVTNSDDVHILSFLGVVPCVDLYVNGIYVGYSEGAHNSAEFDISEFIYEGTNELLAVVHKWCSGTYLECQDMFRENGIFRDVLLYRLPAVYINDYYIRPRKADGKWTMDVEITLEGKLNGCEVGLSLEKDGKVIAGETVKAERLTYMTFDDLDVTEWNAEIPTVYNTYITLYKNGEELMTLRNITGFKTVEIKGNTFTFNGQVIKFKGVNHHDTNGKTGYVMTFDDYEKDVKLIKEYNGNAIRTSHYPPDPCLIALADTYGLYIVDEADIETHGAFFAPHNDINKISHDLKWAPRYLDRVKRMYYRDRSHPCITMWSLGNEAGGYACQDVCYDYLHETCPEIPTHYEGVIHTKRKAYDVVSDMYPTRRSSASARELRWANATRQSPTSCANMSTRWASAPVRWRNTGTVSINTTISWAAASGNGQITRYITQMVRMNTPTAATTARRNTTATSALTVLFIPTARLRAARLRCRRSIAPSEQNTTATAASLLRTQTASAVRDISQSSAR